MGGNGNAAGGAGLFGYASVLMTVQDLRAEECVEAMRLFFTMHHAETCDCCEPCQQGTAICVQFDLRSPDRVWRTALEHAGTALVIE